MKTGILPDERAAGILKNQLTLNEVLREKLKDKGFKKGYEEELRKIRLGYKIAQLKDEIWINSKTISEKNSFQSTGYNQN